jgi:hypothetical protein
VSNRSGGGKSSCPLLEQGATIEYFIARHSARGTTFFPSSWDETL